MTETATVAVRRYQSEDARRLVELFETCFGRPRTVEAWRWRHEDGPHRVELRVLTVDSRVMGFVSRCIFDAWVEGRRVGLLFGGDTMIDPEVQGQGLLKDLHERDRDLDGFEVTLGFPRRDLPVTMENGRSISTCGDLPQWVRWQTGAAVHEDAAWIPRSVGALGSASLRLLAAARARRGRRAVIDVDAASFDRWAVAFDDLAQRSRDYATVLMIRDARHLRWRWLDRPDPAWRIAVVPATDSSSSIDGFVVYGTRARQGRIVDLLAGDASAMQSLVVAAVEQLSRDGVERVLLELADPRPWPARVLRRCGFLPRGQATAMRISSPSAPWKSDKVLDPGLWYITLGDTDHD